jgi:hypothetical protein
MPPVAQSSTPLQACRSAAPRPRCRATTIRDFNGFSAVAFHVGTATGGDGTRYDLETDLRTFRGTYIDRTGRRRFGTFGFI